MTSRLTSVRACGLPRACKTLVRALQEVAISFIVRGLKRYHSRSQCDEHGLTLTVVACGQWARMRRDAWSWDLAS
eukprot:4229637-Pyramimonas_sp.AAC.1